MVAENAFFRRLAQNTNGNKGATPLHSNRSTHRHIPDPAAPHG